MNILQPTPQQLHWQRQEMGLFCHFGINTFNDREWSDGTLDPQSFAPTHFDAAQWVDVAQNNGCKYLMLTAKHHDGFCLWPTQTTDYCVRNSGFRGDVVGEVARACHSAGLHFGLYLSPWDRNAACYADEAAYNAFYARQLTELCSNYGELFEVWFDGAGSEGRVYDWARWMEIVHRLQPNAMVFNLGAPTIRWVGNEDGLSHDPNPYVVNELAGSAFTSAMETMQNGGAYIPPECDVAIRQNWFWQSDDLPTLKSLEHLLGIYYRSVGRGANLLLNLGPNREGLLDTHDVNRLNELHRAVETRFANPIASTCTPIPNGVRLDFGRETACDHLVLQEAIEDGQRIFAYRVSDDVGREICAGHTVGQKKIEVFPRVTCKYLQIEFGAQCLSDARLESVTAFETGHETLPQLGAKLNYSEWSSKADSRS